MGLDQTIIHTAVIQQQVVQRPELVPAYLDAFRLAVSRATGTVYEPTYASPLISRPAPGSVWDWTLSGVAAASVVAGSMPQTAPIGAFGSTGILALDVYFRSSENDRKVLGREILSADGAGLMHLLSHTWELEEEFAHRAADNSLPQEIRERAVKAGQVLDTFRAENNLPPRNAPPEVLAAYLGTSATEKLIADAIDRAMAQASPQAEPEKFDQALSAEFRTLGERLGKVEVIAAKIADYLDKLKAAEADAQADQDLMEIAAGGRLVGMFVGLSDPARGRAVSSLFTGIAQAAVAYNQLSRNVGAVMSLSTVAAGMGGLFMVATALQAFTADQGPNQTEIILAALRQISEHIAELANQVRSLRQEVADFERHLGTRIAELSIAVVSTWQSVGAVLQTVIELNIEEHKAQIEAAFTTFANNPTREHARTVLELAYAKATTVSLSPITSGRVLSPAQLVSRLTGANGRIAWFPLEQVPAVISVAGASLQEEFGGLPQDDERRSEEPSWGRLRLSQGLGPATVGRVGDADCAVPGLLSLCALRAVQVHRAVMTTPMLSPDQAPGAALKFEHFAGELVELASWPARAAQVLGTRSCVRMALLGYERALSDFLTELSRRFVNALPYKDERVTQLHRLFLLNGMRLWEPGGAGQVLATQYRRSPAVEVMALGAHFGPGLAIRPLRGDDAVLVVRCLSFLGRLGQLGAMQSADAFVERPHAGQQMLTLNGRNPPEAAFGSGNFTEILSIGVRSVTGVGADVPVALLRMVDSRRYPIPPNGVAPMMNQPARRGQFAGNIAILPKDLCPAPWDDKGYKALSAILDGFRDSPNAEAFFVGVEDLKHQGISIELCSYGGIGTASAVADAVCSQLEALATSTMQGVIPPDPAVLDRLRVAWVTLAATLGARASINADLAAYRDFVGHCPGFLTDRPEESLNLASPTGWQRLRAAMPTLLGWPLWLSALARGTAPSSHVGEAEHLALSRQIHLDYVENRAAAGDPAYSMPDVLVGSVLPTDSDFGTSLGCAVPTVRLIDGDNVQVQFPKDLPEGGRFTAPMLTVLPKWTITAKEYASLVSLTRLAVGPGE